MLAAPIQKEIKSCYQNLKDQLDNFIPRRAQNYLVAEIAKPFQVATMRNDVF